MKTDGLCFNVQRLWADVTPKTNQGTASYIRYLMRICYSLISYVLVIVGFLIFLVYNEGIVIGDRSAHKPTLHVPQIFYFLTFTFCFAWPYMLPHFARFCKYLQNNIITSSCVFCSIIVIIHYNTRVHPYILADNRHYSFYIWKNLMNRYVAFKYLLAPIYGFALYTFLQCTRHLKVLHRVAYLVCVCAVLVPQLLLEPRYFIVPYLYFRLSLKNLSTWQIVAESLTTFAVNVAQFSIFVNKTFYWQDQEGAQRIAW